MSFYARRLITRTRDRAVILVLTLWIVIVLGVIAASLAFDVQVGSKLTLANREQFIAYNLAKSAIAVGMTHLQNDLLIEQAENPNQLYDAFSDVWAQPGRREKEIEVQIDKDHKDRTYEVEVTDEEGKIPLNHAGPKLLRAMMEYYGYEQIDAEEVAAAIVDYRDADDMAASAPGERENEHYSAALGQRISTDMADDQFAYRTPNEPFLTVEQLLDVYGIQPEVYYGFDPADAEEKELKQRDAIAQGRNASTRTRRSRRQVLPLKDVVTVNTRGQINMNTASEEVLAIMAHASTNFAALDAAKTTAKSIVDFRGGAGKTPDPENAFKSLPDVGKVPGVDLNAFNQLGGMGIQPSFSSETFAVTGIGRTLRAQRTITAIVSRKLEVYDPNSARLSGTRDGKRPPARERQRRGRTRNEQNDDYIRIPAVRVKQWIE